MAPALLAVMAVPDALPPDTAALIQDVSARMEAAERAIDDALASLPDESDYGPVAAQLRELATVSPSLMEWMRQVPPLTAPLAQSIEALSRAAKALRDGRAQLGKALNKSPAR